MAQEARGFVRLAARWLGLDVVARKSLFEEVISEMADRGITQALAYDHHFEQAGFEPLLRRDPP